LFLNGATWQLRFATQRARNVYNGTTQSTGMLGKCRLS